MGPHHVLCVLLCVAAASATNGDNDDNASTSTRQQRLPLVLSRHTEVLTEAVFSGRPEEEEVEEEKGRGGRTQRGMCGIECQSALAPLDPAQQENALAYETLYENATRTLTQVTLQGFNQTSSSWRRATTRRAKRQVYGLDGRFVISDSRFTTRYPFSAAVRLSTGCSGVLVSPRHVLTAAHCVHDGRHYLAGARRLKVGVLQLKSRRGGGRGGRGGGGGGGRRRGGRRRNGRRGGGEEEGAPAEEEEGQNSVDGLADGGEARERKGGRGKRRRGGNGGGGASDRQAPELNRVRRAATAEPRQQQPVFRWSRVKQTHVPRGWIRTAEEESVAGASAPENNDNNSISADYDYALLELRRGTTQRHMEVGVAPAATPLARIHFSAYDSDKGPLNGGGGGEEKVVYRFCSVAQESDDLMYQRCDAQPGAAGAGVYVRQRAEEEATTGAGGAGGGRFQRRVIGVFSGHRWVELEGGEQRDFNVAVRITPAKYAQICHWIHGDPSLCKEM